MPIGPCELEPLQLFIVVLAMVSLQHLSFKLRYPTLIEVSSLFLVLMESPMPTPGTETTCRDNIGRHRLLGTLSTPMLSQAAPGYAKLLLMT